MTITATCSTCGMHHTFAQNKIPHGVTSTKCRKCGNVIPLHVNTPITPPPLPKECPKCGYLHQPQDGHVSERECPRCGVIYEKYDQRMGEILGAAILLGIAGDYLLRTFP